MFGVVVVFFFRRSRAPFWDFILYFYSFALCRFFTCVYFLFTCASCCVLCTTKAYRLKSSIFTDLVTSMAHSLTHIMFFSYFVFFTTKSWCIACLSCQQMLFFIHVMSFKMFLILYMCGRKISFCTANKTRWKGKQRQQNVN